jgi:hypothetical protein
MKLRQQSYMNNGGGCGGGGGGGDYDYDSYGTASHSLSLHSTDRNGHLHTPAALPTGRKPSGPTEQEAE